MTRVKRAFACVAAAAMSVLMTACGGTGGTGTTPPPATYTLTVNSANPASGVPISVAPIDNNGYTDGSTSFTRTYNSGTAVTLTAPATSGGNSFSSWTGCNSTSGAGNATCSVTLNANTTVTANYSAPAAVAPTVTVTAPASIVSGAAFSVTVTVAGPAGSAQVPTGAITLSSQGFSYNAGNLTNGSVTVSVPANTWTVAAGPYTLTATYQPDATSSPVYTTATGTAQVTVTAPVTTYTLTVDSTGGTGGISITDSPADNNGTTSGNPPFTLTYNSGTTVTLTAPATPGWVFTSWTGCASTSGASGNVCTVTMNANTTVTAVYTAPATYTLTVDSTLPASGVPVSITPQGSTSSTPGSTPFVFTGTAGTTYVVTAPSTENGAPLGAWTGCTSSSGDACTITLSANSTVTVSYPVAPTVTVTPASNAIDTAQSLQVTVTVAGPSGDPTPTGSVVLSGGGYTSASTALTGGSASITIPAGSLASGNDTLTARYTPDSGSTGIYLSAQGSSSPVSVAALSTVTVDQSTTGPAVTDKILGVNLESWYDVVQNSTPVLSGLQTAGMQSLRWPGGSWSDVYHWNNGGTPYQCTCANATSCTANSQAWAGNADEAFASFQNSISKAGNLDLALTANYGTNETCNGGGDPSEAAAWAAAAVTNGQPASHITIGNEEYGSWETDLHAAAHDPTTYADAVIGTNGYYTSIKNAITTAGGNPSDTLVGVVVDADCTSSSGCTNGWDSTMLPLAKGSYDFVEFHYYPEYENGYDSNLIGTASPSYVQNFTADINAIKQELTTAGTPDTPIYVGEISSNSANGGTQNWSITQALYAGQILGEAMNDGVSRLTWWDGYGNCSGTSGLPPDNSTLYGWQDWGAQDIFSAGSADASDGCTNDGPAGTLSPTAMAFQLFSNVAVSGENVLTASVSGDTTDVRAYSATHSGGTALVLFNLNKTTAELVSVALSSQNSTTDMKVMTYDKEMYDYTNVNCQADQTGQPNGNNCTYDPTHNYTTVDWVQQPLTTDLGAQNLPYTLTLQPWSMNVILIK